MELTNQDLDERLLDLGSEIHSVELALVTASRKYETLKAEYENSLDISFLSLKATKEDATVRELEANSRIENHSARMKLIEAEAVYKGLKSKVNQIETKIGILQSIIKLRTSEMRNLQ
jgi:hypothetical protein